MLVVLLSAAAIAASNSLALGSDRLFLVVGYGREDFFQLQQLLKVQRVYTSAAMYHCLGMST